MTVGGLQSLQLKNGDRAWAFVCKNRYSNGVIGKEKKEEVLAYG